MERHAASAPTDPAGCRSTLDVDRYVSSRIRQRRIYLALTQQQMADLIGVSFQQIHKYESGISRISAGRLYHLACALGVEINYFFRDAGAQIHVRELAPQQRMLLELACSFASIKSGEHQQALCRLVRVMSRGDGARKVPTSITHVLEDNGVTA